MRAVVVTKYGGPEVLRAGSTSTNPTPAPASCGSGCMQRPSIPADVMLRVGDIDDAPARQQTVAAVPPRHGGRGNSRRDRAGRRHRSSHRRSRHGDPDSDRGLRRCVMPNTSLSRPIRSWLPSAGSSHAESRDAADEHRPHRPPRTRRPGPCFAGKILAVTGAAGAVGGYVPSSWRKAVASGDRRCGPG